MIVMIMVMMVIMVIMVMMVRLEPDKNQYQRRHAMLMDWWIAHTGSSWP